MTRRVSPTERKALYHARYQGRDVVEILNYSIVHGKTYAEIRFKDGRVHTVPTEEITINEEK